MRYLQGIDRTQLVLFPQSLDHSVSADHEVRAIDTFVNSLNLAKMGFTNMDVTEEGRPAYHPSDLLKLYIYGYLNRTRSSRELEKETKRNIEVMWLIKNLQPDHNTISNFRRDNSQAIRNVFRQTVSIASHMDLIGGKLIGGDSVKLRAQNSKKNNYNQSKIDRHLQYIENKLEEYNQLLESSEPLPTKEAISKEIKKHQQRKEKYQQLEHQLKETGEAQVSTSDPDSRQLIMRNNITEVAYNTQTTVDAKHRLILDYNVTNHNDAHAMSNMVRRATAILNDNTFTVVFDKGYHTGSEIKACHEMGIETVVAIPAKSSSSQAPDHRYNVEHFHYDKTSDTYICPQGHELKSNGSWYSKTKDSKYKQYKTAACKHCSFMSSCTQSKQNRRVIERSDCTENVERNRQTVNQNPQLYKQRQAIVEHPYGTIKRQWGYDHTLIKRGIERVSSDIGLIFLAYNMRRLINILGKDHFKQAMLVFLQFITVILRLKLSFGTSLCHFYNIIKNGNQKTKTKLTLILEHC